MTTTTRSNLNQESHVDTTAPRPTGRRLTSADVRRIRADQDAKIASFEQLAGISSATRDRLIEVDLEVEAEWRRARRTARANRLAWATAAISSFRGGE